MTHKKFKT